jgi:hypothetical protein
MKDGNSLSLTLPYRILFKLGRSDENSKSIIFRHSQPTDFRRCRFVLLHETSSGLQKVDVPEPQPGRTFEEDADTVKFNGYNHCIWELPPSGREQQLGELMGNYQKTLVAGEKYHFFWPGMEIDMWEWGTRGEWQGKELKSQATRDTKLPRLVLPASNVLSFTAKHEDEPWPERARFEEAGNSFESINVRELEWRRKKYPPPLPPPLGPEARV